VRRPRTLLLVAALGFGTALPAGPAVGPPAARAADGRSPKEILDKADDLFRGRSSRGRMTMTVRTANYQRALTLEFWNKGKEKSLVRILDPQKERGTATLRAGQDVWNWLPKVGRVVKVPSSMMGGNWMGSHFTNDDLVKQSRMADDFTHQQTFEGTRDGQAVIELTLTPRPDAAVVWGKVVVTVRGTDLLPLAIAYFDEDGKLARTLRFSEFRTLGGRTVPAKLTVTPIAPAGESTEVAYQDLQFDVPLDDALFSIQNLQR